MFPDNGSLTEDEREAVRADLEREAHPACDTCGRDLCAVETHRKAGPCEQASFTRCHPQAFVVGGVAYCEGCRPVECIGCAQHAGRAA